MAPTIDSRSAVRAESIRTHLRELLACDAFSTSPKLSRFLEFTVERTLTGESDALKEYRLGVEIYDRPPRTTLGLIRSFVSKHGAFGRNSQSFTRPGPWMVRFRSNTQKGIISLFFGFRNRSAGNPEESKVEPK